MLDTVKIYMEEWQGLGKGEENYSVLGMLDIGGRHIDTVRYGKESIGNKLVVYIIIVLVKGEEGLVSWMWRTQWFI